MKIFTGTVCVSIFCLVNSAIVYAQRPEGLIPPRQDTQSATGVSFNSGSFSTSTTDLKIGVGEFPQALALERIYRSDAKPMPYDGLSQRGWSTNLWGALTVAELPNIGITLPGFPARKQWLYSAILGDRSVGFVEKDTVAGDYSGPFTPLNVRTPDTLEVVSNYVVMTNGAGDEFKFSNISGAWLLTELSASDGTKLNYTYANSKIKSVFSNRGIAILFEGSSDISKACAVNLRQTYATPTSSCPLSAASVSFSYHTPSYSSIPELMSATNAVGQITQYSYSSVGNLECIADPGQSSCKISNLYNVCTRLPSQTYDPPDLHYYEQVISQVTASGETFTYNFPASRSCPPSENFGGAVVIVSTGVGSYTVKTEKGGLPAEWEDELGRRKVWVYDYANVLSEKTTLVSSSSPEGNEMQFGQDFRGNFTGVVKVPKPGSNLSSIVQNATYPSSCSVSTRKVCNKPTSVTDANGNTTNYAYDSAHGGILSVMEPAPSSGEARPLHLTTWVQRYAYIKNSSGALVQASSSVWVKSTETQCQTAPGSNPSPLCDSSAGKIVTTYEYGANGTGDSLLVKGVKLVADGATQRTCYGYDSADRQISETKPNANLTSCP